MTENAATPTPWTFDDTHDDGIGYTLGPNRETIDHHGDMSLSAETNKANAALKIRAVNAHARLVEALELLVDEKIDYMRINKLGDPETQHTIKLARAALAAARE